MFETRPLSGALGIEILDVNLSKTLSETQFEEMYRAWIGATVLLFRGQNLTPEAQLSFARRFGPIMGYVSSDNQHPVHPELLILSNLKEEGRPVGAVVSGRYWHTDGHYFREPPSASILYALEVPRIGGDTWFANMFAAYDALAPDVKKRIDGLKVIISRVRSRPYNYPDRPPVTDDQRRAWPDMSQPMVRTHPVSGRKALYVGGNVPWRVEGMADEDAAELVTHLQQFAIQSQFTYCHRWRAGDVLVWDNRSAIHKATPYDAIRDRRLMHRLTVAGDLPF